MKLKSVWAALAACAFLCAAYVSPLSAFAAGVSADVTARAVGSYTAANDLGSVTYRYDVSKLLQLTPGTAAGKADKLFSDERTIGASSSENLDLAGGLTDPFGASLTFVKVRAILVIAAAGNTNNVVVGGAGSNTFVGPFGDATDTVAIGPGRALLITAPAAGWTVTASTGDILKVANSGSGTGVTYQIIVIGTSA